MGLPAWVVQSQMDRLDIRTDTAQSAENRALAEVLGPKGLLTGLEDCPRQTSDQCGLRSQSRVAVPRTRVELCSVVAFPPSEPSLEQPQHDQDQKDYGGRHGRQGHLPGTASQPNRSCKPEGCARRDVANPSA